MVRTSAPSPSPDPAMPPPYGSTAEGYRPARTGQVVGVITGIVLIFLLIVGGFVFWVFSLVRNSAATATAVALAGRDARVEAITGLPLKTGWFVSGHVDMHSGGTGEATLTIPVRGPLGRGNVYAIERRVGGGLGCDDAGVLAGEGPERYCADRGAAVRAVGEQIRCRSSRRC